MTSLCNVHNEKVFHALDVCINLCNVHNEKVSCISDICITPLITYGSHKVMGSKYYKMDCTYI